MLSRKVGAKRAALAAAALARLALACSVAEHECYERRDCPESDAPIDIGADDGWNTGGGAGPEPESLAGASGDNRRQPSGDSGDGGDGGDSGDGGKSDSAIDANDSAPTVRLVSPSDGALGVAQDAQIRIVFSRPMATAATEAAYVSSDLPASNLDFSWDDSNTTLTLSPRAPLQYADNAANGTLGLAFPARLYHYGFSALARDPRGHSLAATRYTFSTLRRASLELPADSQRTGNWTEGEDEGIHNCLREPSASYVPTVCVGDDANNVRYHGFLSFDLSALPPTISEFSSARLLADALVHGAPESLGDSRWEHVAYGELGEAALGVLPLSASSPLFAPAALLDQSALSLDLDVTTALRDDFANRVARSQRSQYRLGFAKVVANNHWDDIELPRSNIRLALSFLLP